MSGYYDDGTSGHAGGASSRERAEREDAAGITGKRSQEVLRVLIRRAHRGATSAEVEYSLGIGHGSASGTLTRLQRTGKAIRSTTRRNRQEIYFAADHFPADHTEAPYRSTRYSSKKMEAKGLREAALALWNGEEGVPAPGERITYARWLDARAEALEVEIYGKSLENSL